MLRSMSLPKGSYVKLQPHSKDFLDISNPRAVLETTLRNFSCLTVGDAVPIHYNNKTFWINIVEAKPADAISVIETDCNVDFAPPLDYVEPTPVAPQPSSAAPSSQGKASSAAAAAPEDVGGVQEEAVDEGTFLAFSGSGCRLDGKAVTESKPVPVRLAPKSSLASSSSMEGQPRSAPDRKKSGKLMFKDRLAAKFAAPTPGSTKPAPKPTEPAKKTKEEEGEESKKTDIQGIPGHRVPVKIIAFANPCRNDISSHICIYMQIY